jgi:hypothetical protein
MQGPKTAQFKDPATRTIAKGAALHGFVAKEKIL